MGHAISKMNFPATKSKREILSICAEIANENGDYEDQITGIRFNDTVLKNFDEAMKWIDRNDSGWYDQLAVKYKGEKETMWLVKIEYHC